MSSIKGNKLYQPGKSPIQGNTVANFDSVIGSGLTRGPPDASRIEYPSACIEKEKNIEFWIKATQMNTR
jgi:hypothetical protein